ncbi:heterokaryon incompatibility protein-domain-containing protein [Apiospora arundinis]|uniref:Heterokaryon incompatibility protein-domain-containing protein n=1 Tax=Apiospora arundinis TaxID=335852 RepID=A0ABR2HPX1_9PEZI
MRLINVTSYLIKDFIGDDTPPYAILSHTWGPGEVTLQDMQAEFGGGDEAPYPSNNSSRIRASSKEGFSKIRYTCEQAAKDGLEWAWVDTCCIDKTSSAELSEAINSMYRWYNQADICYAYLVDVTLDLRSGGLESRPSRSPSTIHSALTLLDEAVAGSRWLTRGFTLQELLAPRDITFYNAHWTMIGSRNVKLRDALAFATGIDSVCLMSGEHARLADYSIATRMSWAAHRSCTRTEDVAYCLMGIFDINMPMLYGEGKKAFIRLQEEILKETEDHSLFAWSVTEDDVRAWCPTSIFAESPADFAGSGNIQRPATTSRGITSITKLGLSIQVGVAFPDLPEPPKEWPYYLYGEPYNLQYFTLDCGVIGARRRMEKPSRSRIKIALLQDTRGVICDPSTPSFCRLGVPWIETEPIIEVRHSKERTQEERTELKRIYIRKNLSLQEHNMFHHGTIQLSYSDRFSYILKGSTWLGSSDFAARVGRGGQLSMVSILTNPLVITDTVKWSITLLPVGVAVGIGLGPDTLHCRAMIIEGSQDADAVIAAFNKPGGPTTTCVDYKRKRGRLASDKVTTSTGYTRKVELFHDQFPSSTRGTNRRLHLLAILSAE